MPLRTVAVAPRGVGMKDSIAREGEKRKTGTRCFAIHPLCTQEERLTVHTGVDLHLSAAFPVRYLLERRIGT